MEATPKKYTAKYIQSIENDIEETKGSQVECIKYPTFDDIYIEQELKQDGITFEGLLMDIRSCDEALKYFSSQYDVLLLESSLGAEIQKKFFDHKMNYISYKIYALIILRQVTLFYFLLQKKFSNDEREIAESEKYIQENYIDVDESLISQKFVDENTRYFDKEKLDEQEEENRTITFELLRTLIKKEKALIEFDRNSGEKFTPSIVSMNICVKMLCRILDHSINDIQTISTFSDIAHIKEELLVHFFNNLTKIEIFINFFLLCYKIPSDNVFNLPEDGETWKNIKLHFDRVFIYSRHVINKKLQKVVDMVILGNASISKGYNQFSSRALRVASAGWYMAYFFFNKKKAKMQSMKFLMNPDNEIAQIIWNMMDSKGLKSIIKIGMPRISYSRKWYLKRTQEEVTIDFLQSQLKKVNDGKTVQFGDQMPLDQIIDTMQHDSMINVGFGRVPPKSNDLIVSSDKKREGSYVKVKILSHSHFYILNQRRLLDMLSCCSVQRNYTRDSLIIHVHGGGFISMSASSHENYTRKWVNALEVPLISIDYRLAPDHPFPKALDDVYQAYMWIITYAPEMFRINLNKIILVGDSAGGNLVLGLTYLLIIQGLRLPSAIFLAYPALRMSLNEMSCSYLNVLTDQVIPYLLLKFCNDAYKRLYDNDHDPFLSPLYMDDKILKLLPPVRIFVGSSDPLRDDSILFLKRLVDLKKDVQMKELKYFPHGFLNYDYALLMPEAAVGNEMVIEEIEKFIAN